MIDKDSKAVTSNTFLVSESLQSNFLDSFIFTPLELITGNPCFPRVLLTETCLYQNLIEISLHEVFVYFMRKQLYTFTDSQIGNTQIYDDIII